MLETEYNEAEVLETARLNAEKRGMELVKKQGREEFVLLLKKNWSPAAMNMKEP